MSEEYKKGPHTVYDIQYHLVWVTKYRYHILKGKMALRARELIRQTCEVRKTLRNCGRVSWVSGVWGFEWPIPNLPLPLHPI
ncbi:MAG: transposase [Deltaproteobacteria bacterium]|nr:transposase [Deltaproteobacteria bacterium]